MKDLPSTKQIIPLTDEQHARIMASLDKTSNVVFVDFGGKK